MFDEQRSMFEDEFKQILSDVGLAAPRFRVVSGPKEFDSFRASWSSSTVVKSRSRHVVHKAENACVQLDIESKDVPAICREIAGRVREVTGEGTPEVLLEEQIDGNGEIFIGFQHHEHLGPLLLVGPGGSGVEQNRKKIHIALAPLSEEQAEELASFMVHEYLTVETEARKTAITRLKDVLLALANEDGFRRVHSLVEFDINPITWSGEEFYVLDGWARSSEEIVPEFRSAITELSDDSFRAALFPESVAVVGASTREMNLGTRLVSGLQEGGFAGPIYPVSRSQGFVRGIPSIASPSELPMGIDRALVCLPPKAVPEAVRSLAERETKVVQIYSSGFDEYDAEGRALGEEILKAVAGTATRVIGPNCAGTYSPSSGQYMLSVKGASGITGRAAFIGQSGGLTQEFVRKGAKYGVDFHSAVSVGNCLDVKVDSLLQHYLASPEVSIVALYLESIENGRAILELMDGARKPVLLLRGGRTGQGERAAASHTGALLAGGNLFERIFESLGGMICDSRQELFDVLMMHQVHDLAIGANGLMFVGGGGGEGVLGADDAFRAGMRLSEPSDDLLNWMAQLKVPGSSIANPIDVHPTTFVPDANPNLAELLNRVSVDPDTGSIICYLPSVIRELSASDSIAIRHLEGLLDHILAAAKVSRVPISVVLRSDESEVMNQFNDQWFEPLVRKGVTPFSTVRDAVNAHGNLYKISSRKRSVLPGCRYGGEASEA